MAANVRLTKRAAFCEMEDELTLQSCSFDTFQDSSMSLVGSSKRVASSRSAKMGKLLRYRVQFNISFLECESIGSQSRE